MFCCQGKVDGSTGASLAGRGMSFGATPLMAASAIVSAEIVAGLNVWMASANGREAALVLRKVRRLSMRSIMDDDRIPYECDKNFRQLPDLCCSEGDSRASQNRK
jgi:hypothetical protein